jgi:long-subunit acyl-CoA synthetase (AMP-forming)
LTLIYTSGTTGPPKGVQTTHANMLAELRGMHDAIPLASGGRQVSFLPSAHIADRWASHYGALMTYANTLTPVPDPATLPRVLAEVRPTVFGAVPRVWEKFRAALEAAAGAGLADAARADPAVGAAIRARLGLDQAQWLCVGAAPAPVELLEFFAALGLPICEVWGMSETSCVATTNRPGRTRFGSVGEPIAGMELRIADDGELLVRGPLVMAGYRGREDLTAEAVDGAGWLHTGDVARIDDDGFVWIVDRKKELIINAAGKNMSPANIEMRLKAAGPLIGQACVFGDRRPYNVAILVLDPDTAAGLDPLDPGVVARVQGEVDGANGHLSRVEQIKRFALLSAEWLPGGDELTPTMKLKRRAVAAKYGPEVDALYGAG